MSKLILVALPEECLKAVSKAIDIACHVKRELTDEEIDSLIMDVAEKPTDEDLYEFARAILKKASEK